MFEISLLRFILHLQGGRFDFEELVIDELANFAYMALALLHVALCGAPIFSKAPVVGLLVGPFLLGMGVAPSA